MELSRFFRHTLGVVAEFLYNLLSEDEDDDIDGRYWDCHVENCVQWSEVEDVDGA